MRQTFGQLIQTSKNYCVDDNSSSPSELSDTETFIKNEINTTVSEIFDMMSGDRIAPLPYTASTVADQQYYHLPPMTGNVETITLAYGGITYDLKPVSSQNQWNNLNMVSATTSAIPQYFFPRRYDFGLYPIPSGTYTLTITINPTPYNMESDDSSDGTIAITNGSQTVTGTSTAFVSGMVGRWLYEYTNRNWQRISAYSSATSLTLETAYIDSSISGATYIVGHSPEIPDIFHHMIPFRVSGVYEATISGNPDKGQKLINTFWTGDPNNFKREGKIFGGVLGALKRQKSKGGANSQIVDNGVRRVSFFDERWKTTLS